MATKTNGLKVIQDPDPQSVGDWVRDIGADMGLCERKYTERLYLLTNEAMKVEIDNVCKAEGGVSVGEMTRRLWMEKIAKLYIRKEACKTTSENTEEKIKKTLAWRAEEEEEEGGGRMEIKGNTKLMLAGFLIIAILGLILLYGVNNTIALMQNNLIDLVIGIGVGALIMYLIMQGVKELQTPMTSKQTFSLFCWACSEELELPIVEGQVMFNLEGATLIQKGRFLAYRGRLYAGDSDYTTWTIIIDSTIRDPSRFKSPLAYRTPKYLNDKEILKMIDELASPTGVIQGKEAVVKTLKEASEVKKAIAEEEG